MCYSVQSLHIVCFIWLYVPIYYEINWFMWYYYYVNWFIVFWPADQCRHITLIQNRAMSPVHSRKQYIHCLKSDIFIIYTNMYYLHEWLVPWRVCKAILFVDDFTVYSSSKDIIKLPIAINNDLKLLSGWFQANKLSLNVTRPGI